MRTKKKKFFFSASNFCKQFFLSFRQHNCDRYRDNNYQPDTDCIYHFLIDFEPQTEFHLLKKSQSENGKYNLISVDFNKNQKSISLCETYLN